MLFKSLRKMVGFAGYLSAGAVLTALGVARGADFMPQTLGGLYEGELGAIYKAADVQQLHEANELIEKYFAADSSAQRKGVVAQLEATKLDPNLLGKISRLRLSWPELTAGVYYINEQIGAYPVKYFLGVPKGYQRERAWPLVIKLPGINAFVTNPAPDADEVVRIYSAWIKEELVAHPDALVLMPLVNLKELYGPSFLGMNTVYQPIMDATAHANIDPARVYILGHSMAAHAVWNLALNYTTYFAALAPLAGSAEADWQRLRLVNLRNTLPVVWADTTDPVIPFNQSSDIVSALRKLNIDVDYSQSSGVGHVPTPEIVEGVYHKMRARTRDLYPAHISLQSDRPEAIFNRLDWVQVYQELESGAEQQIRLQLGTGPMRLYEKAYTLDATLDHNTVKIETKNVESMRLYFNDKMVDFSQPVVVVVNNKERFRGVVTASIDEMLKDQLFIGRGWRYFSAVVDIDLLDVPARSPKPDAGGEAAGTPATRPHGTITIYNDDGSVQRVIGGQ